MKITVISVLHLHSLADRVRFSDKIELQWRKKIIVQ